ncbi:MAG: hypothetical protein IKJ27_06035 [Clostridia bacterium]|nr:hypothetical protein [Clostridia bacterium]
MITNPLIEEIISLVNKELLVALFAKAIRGFNREELVIPVNTIIASFVPYENKSSYCFDDETAALCLKTDLTLRMNVYAHSSRKAKQANAIAEVICNFLSEYYIDTLSDFRIGDVKYDDNANSIVIPCFIHFTYTTCPLDGTDDILGERVPESFFCKNHVNNTDLHLSQADRTFLSEPAVIGTYTGNNGDSATQDIALGFRPRAVIVYGNTHHAANYSTSDGLSHCYFSFAAGSSSLRGLSILDNGFRVRTYKTTNAVTHLNDSDSPYTYIAFR